MLIKEKVKPIQPFTVGNNNIHGHVCVDLHNTKSGFTERIQGDNLVTNAAQDILNLAAIGHNIPPYDLLPLATNLLGGLFIFDGALQENVNNVKFPGSQAKFVGSAGDRVDTSINILGVRNNEESGIIQGGYKTVWDFSTNCCNGTIRSLARTSLTNGNDLGDNRIIFRGAKTISNPNDGQIRIGYFYNNKIYWGGDIYYSPFQGERVSYQNSEYLQFANQNFTTTLNINSMQSSSQLNDILYTVNSRTIYSYKLSTDETTTLIELPTSVWNTGCYGVKENYVYSISDFKLYKTNLTNVSNSIKLADLPSSQRDYLEKIKIFPNGKTLVCSPYDYDNNNLYNVLIYDDDTIIPIYNKRGLTNGNMGRYQFLQNKPFYLLQQWDSRDNILYIYIDRFLGTIFNLPAPITKTANQTMKITYTLTNV